MRWILASLLVASAAAQTTFRSDVRLVNLSVTVRDSGGRLVENLAPARRATQVDPIVALRWE